jgi:hypothetical protein
MSKEKSQYVGKSKDTGEDVSPKSPSPEPGKVRFESPKDESTEKQSQLTPGTSEAEGTREEALVGSKDELREERPTHQEKDDRETKHERRKSTKAERRKSLMKEATEDMRTAYHKMYDGAKKSSQAMMLFFGFGRK